MREQMGKQPIAAVPDNGVSTYPGSPLRRIEEWVARSVPADGVVPSGLDMYRTGDDLVVEAAVPGVPGENVTVVLEGRMLRIQAVKEESDEERQRKENGYRQERVKAFDYITTLPLPIHADAVDAEIEKGVVTVKAPIVMPSQPRRIVIHAHEAGD